jgi:hypothetical protein
VPDQSRPNRVPWPGVALLLLSSVPSLLGGRRRRRPRVQGRELNAYRRNLTELTSMIDLELVSLADLVDALRRRDADPDAALVDLQSSEEKLDRAAESLRGILAPEELHGLHAEYEASLERAIRGIVTAERGCGITKLPYRPPDDEEPLIYWKRGHLNILHARLRMAELVATLLTWEPGMPAEATVAARLGRFREG